MNLKGFKKVHEDEKKATLVNQRGHQITLAKSQLSKRHLDGIGKLPLYSYEGNDIEERSIPERPIITPADAEIAPPMEEDSSVATLAPRGAGPMGTPLASAVDAPQEQVTPPTQYVPDTDLLAEPTQAPQSQPQYQQVPTQQGQPGATPNQDRSYGDYLVREMQAVGRDLSAGNIKAKTYHDLLFKDEEGKDKPWWGKALSIFGMMMAGGGAGLSKQPNQLMAMLDNQIKSDLEAQKADRTMKQNYYTSLKDALYEQSAMSKNTADIAHLATQDTVTLDAYGQAISRRLTLDRFWNDVVMRYQEGTPERKNAENVFAQMVMASDKADMSAGALINGRAALFGNSQGMMGGPLSRGGGQQGAAKQQQKGPIPVSQLGHDPGVNTKVLDGLMRKSQMKLPGAPSEAQISQLTNEAAAIKEIRARRRGYIDSFNKLDNLFLSGVIDKNMRATYANALNVEMAKALAGRYVTAEAADQAKGTLPHWMDIGGRGSKTREEKLRKGLEIFDNMEKEHSVLSDFFGTRIPPQYPVLDSVYEKQSKNKKGASQYKKGDVKYDKNGMKYIHDGKGFLPSR